MITENMVYNFVSAMDEGNKMYSNPDGFCFFLRLDKKTLDKVRTNRQLLTNPKLIADLMKQEGKNIHFISAYGKGVQVIRKAIKYIIANESPDSVSWYNKNMSRFIFRRVKCRQ